VILFRLDENVSYKIAEAAVAVGIPQELKLETPYSRGETGEPDVAWIRAFAKRGGKKAIRCVFSGDGQIRNNEPERAACEDAGLVLFFAPSPTWWRDLRKEGQAAYFIRWLPAMVQIARKAVPGSQFKLPGTFSPKEDLVPLPRVASTQKAVRPERKKTRSLAATPLLEMARQQSQPQRQARR
jgi:hypothetical protein